MGITGTGTLSIYELMSDIFYDQDTCRFGSFCGRFHMDQGFNCPHLHLSNLFSNWINNVISIYKIVINIDTQHRKDIDLDTRVCCPKFQYSFS